MTEIDLSLLTIHELRELRDRVVAEIAARRGPPPPPFPAPAGAPGERRR